MVFSLFFSAQKTHSIKLKKYKIASLSSVLRETSGLAMKNGKLFTMNDGGNPQEFYEISPKTGEIIETHHVNFPNKDWEAIATDGQCIYLADVGNNGGKRKDLTVYKVQEKEGKGIRFEYKNQLDFNVEKDRHDFDAEALIFHREKFHLFSKEWVSKNTSRYEIDPQQDIQQIDKKESFPLGFLATDASYFQGKLYIVGYNKKAKAYLVVFNEDENGNFFGSQPKRYKLGSVLKLGQIEGVEVDEQGVYISAESFRKFGFKADAGLYFIPHSKINFNN